MNTIEKLERGLNWMKVDVAFRYEIKVSESGERKERHMESVMGHFEGSTKFYTQKKTTRGRKSKSSLIETNVDGRLRTGQTDRQTDRHPTKFQPQSPQSP